MVTSYKTRLPTGGLLSCRFEALLELCVNFGLYVLSQHSHCGFFAESHWGLRFPPWVSLEISQAAPGLPKGVPTTACHLLLKLSHISLGGGTAQKDLESSSGFLSAPLLGCRWHTEACSTRFSFLGTLRAPIPAPRSNSDPVSEHS